MPALAADVQVADVDVLIAYFIPVDLYYQRVLITV